MTVKYKYPRSFLLQRDNIVETENLNDIFTPNRCEFYSASAKCSDVIYFFEHFFEASTMTATKVSTIWPSATQKWKSLVAAVANLRPELCAYLPFASGYAEHEMSTQQWGIVPSSRADDNGYDSEYSDTQEGFIGLLERIKAGYDYNADKPARTHLSSPSSARTLVRLTAYILDKPLFSLWNDSTGRRPSEIVRIIGQDQQYVTTSDYNNFSAFSISPMPPLPPGHAKQSLYRILSHSADATQYLGKRTVVTKEIKRGDKVIKFEKEYQPTLYGVELELATDHGEHALIDAQGDDPFLILKHDGSVSGKGLNKIELVTKPMDLRSHRRRWAKFLSNFYNAEKQTYDKFDCSKTTSNGMHVHVDREAFLDKDHVRRFAYMFAHPDNYDFLFAISERNSGDLSSWARFPSYNTVTKDKHIFMYCVSDMESNGKYSVVNFNKSKTIEVRMFKGLVSYATVLKNLEFVDSFLEYTRTSSQFSSTLERYVTWLHSLPESRYKVLRAMTTKMNTDEMILKSQTRRYFAAANLTADEAVTIIHKRNIPQTKELVSFLNQRFGGRKVFHWDNRNKVAVLVASDRAHLHPMDAEFQAMYSKTRKAA